MYGTVAHLRMKPGEEQSVIDLMDGWNRERRSKATGIKGGYVYRLDDDPSQLVLVAVFSDQDSYRANAEDPGQDQWYRRVRDHLVEDPVWEDGELVTTF